jgi:hypothetical protein
VKRLALFLVLGSALVAAASASAVDRSTLSGQVLIRGAGLGCLRAPCWVPAARVTVTIAGEDGVVARAVSGRDGRFRVVVAPGLYTLRAPGLMSLTRDGKTQVQLKPGQLRRMTLVIAHRAGAEPQPRPPAPAPGGPQSLA